MANAIIDRATLTAAVDDDGTNTTGTVENKAWLASVLYDPIDAVVSALFAACQGRLTLQSGTAISTSDQTAKTTLYFTPYLGARIGLYDGSQWKMVTFAEISVSVPATTSTLYDVFIPYNAGAAGTPELVAWTNDTTRATALTTQDGIYVKTGDATRRYVGCMRTTTVSGQTEDSLAKRYVWNYYNRLRRPLRAIETADTWNYTTATYRAMNNSAANALDVVIGVAEVMLEATAVGAVLNTTTATAAMVSIGEDSTTTPVAGVLGQRQDMSVINFVYQIRADLRRSPAVGRHTYTALERSGAAGTTSWFGDNGDGTLVQAGIHGSIDG